MNFSQITEITIPEGKVVKIQNGNYTLWEAKKARLPKEYQEVEYIHIPHNAYIDTGFTPANDTTFYIKLQAYDGYPFGTGNAPRLAMALSGGGGG